MDATPAKLAAYMAAHPEATLAEGARAVGVLPATARSWRKRGALTPVDVAHATPRHATPPNPDDDEPRPGRRGTTFVEAAAMSPTDLRNAAIVELLLVGWSCRRIARKLGISKSAVHRAEQQPEVIAAVAEQRAGMKAEVERLLPFVAIEAIERLRKNLKDPDGHVSNTAVGLALKATGLAGVQKVAVTADVRVGVYEALSDDELEAEIARAEALARGLVVDVGLVNEATEGDDDDRHEG